MGKGKFMILAVLGMFILIGFLTGCSKPIETPPIDNATPESQTNDEPSNQTGEDKYVITYTQDILSYKISIELPNPCYGASLTSNVVETSEGSAEVLLDIATTPPKRGTMCAQVIDYKSFTGNIDFSKEDIKPSFVRVKLNGKEVYTKNLS